MTVATQLTMTARLVRHLLAPTLLGTAVLALACSSKDSATGTDEPNDSNDDVDLRLQLEEEDPEDLAFGDPGSGGDGDGDAALSGDFGDAAGTGGTSAMGGAGFGGASSDPVDPEPIDHPPLDPSTLSHGDLTAGIWDDNRSFDFFRIYQAGMHENLMGLMPFNLEDDYLPVRLRYVEEQQPAEKLDIAVVLDTTGSMGDEISYLQGEFLGISSAINDRYPNAEQRWSLVVYRDTGPEEYLVNSNEFSEDLEVFHDFLLRQRANGGGDFPEAPDAGLAEAGELDWRDGDDVARMIFWVADAPHHRENAQAMADAVRTAQGSDIHIYPVGASGLDEFTEFTMRQAAQLTYGRYLFLTDDSGIGGVHAEPTLPCYYVTSLSDAILRGVDAEMTGEYTLPSSTEIIRAEGSFAADGLCNYGERSQTLAF